MYNYNIKSLCTSHIDFYCPIGYNGIKQKEQLKGNRLAEAAGKSLQKKVLGAMAGSK